MGLFDSPPGEASPYSFFELNYLTIAPGEDSGQLGGPAALSSYLTTHTKKLNAKKTTGTKRVNNHIR